MRRAAKWAVCLLAVCVTHDATSGRVSVNAHDAIPSFNTLAPLEAMSGPAGLTSTYRLPVVELPPPPHQLPAGIRLTTGQSAVSDMVGFCPVDVRAIVGGGDAGRFVVLAAGGESRVVRVGQSMRIGGEAVTVLAITASEVSLSRGDVVVRCALSGLTKR